MTKILLIGAGYVGMRLLDAWPEAHFITTATTREKRALLQNMAQVEKAIFPDEIGEVLEACCGAVVCVAPKEGAGYEETYLGTAKRIHIALENRAKPFYLLYISSTSVYGKQEIPAIDESTPPAPSSPEGTILLKTEEEILGCADTRIKACILRPGGIYGSGRTLAERARRLSGREIPGAGDKPTNHSHVDDIVEAIKFCFLHQLEGIYNIVCDAHPTRKELYNALCANQGIPSPFWNPALPSLHGSNSSVSSEKIKNAGFRFSHPDLETK